MIAVSVYSITLPYRITTHSAHGYRRGPNLHSEWNELTVHMPHVFFSTPAEIEKMASDLNVGYNTSKEEMIKNVHDDVIFLAEDEPIIKGKQGKRLLWKGK